VNKLTEALQVESIERFTNKVHHGHVLDLLRGIPDDTISLIITSPPYWGLRSYGEEAKAIWDGDPTCQHDWQSRPYYKDSPIRNESLVGREEAPEAGGPERWQTNDFCRNCGAWKGQLGLEPNVDMFVQHLMQVFRELKRVLKPTGSFYLNIGDTYASSMGDHGDETAGFSKEAMVTSKPPKPKETGRLLIPSRVAIAMTEDGWHCMDEIIWRKPNHMPTSVKSRLANSWEPIFRFVKNNKTMLWRIMRTHSQYKSGEWLNKRPLTPHREWLLKEDWETENTLLGREVLKKGTWVGKKPPKELQAGSRANWLGFSYYYELDSIREPHSSLNKLPQRFNIRVRDAKEGRLEGKWGDKVHATQAEVSSYNEKEYSGKMSEQAEQLNSPRARQARPGYDAQSKFYAEGGKNPADVVEDKVSLADKKPGDIIELDGVKYIVGWHHDTARRDLKVHGDHRDYGHEMDDTTGLRLFRLDGKDPGDVTESKYSEEQEHIVGGAWKRAGTPRTTHELGKNPSDVMEHRDKDDERYALDHLSRPPEPEINPERAFSEHGKNPGDVAEYEGKFSDESKGYLEGKRTSVGAEWKAALPHGYHPLGRAPQDTVDTTKGENVPGQTVQHGLRFEGHQGDWSHEQGKNPGDVVTTRKIKGDALVDGGWHGESAVNQKHTGYYRPDGTPLVDFDKGKNPGDVVYDDTGRSPGSNLGEKGQANDQKQQWRPESRLFRKDGKVPDDTVQEFEDLAGKTTERQRLIADKLGFPHQGGQSGTDRGFATAGLYDPTRTSFYHEKGKNPSDVVESDSKYVGTELEHNYVGTGRNPRIQEMKEAGMVRSERSTALGADPEGKNPGDVIQGDAEPLKEDQRRAANSMIHHGESSRSFHWHPKDALADGREPYDRTSIEDVMSSGEEATTHFNRKYALSETYFDDISSEEQAYWFGFLWGDGSTDETRLRVGLSEVDKDHLEKLKQCLGSEHPLRYDEVRKAYFLEIRSVRLAESLRKAGFRQGLPSMPEALKRHFVRGLFDADGNVTEKDGEYALSITNEDSALLYWAGTFLSEAIQCEPRTIQSDHNVFRVRFNGTDQLRGIREIFYRSSTVWLNRKRASFPTGHPRWSQPELPTDFWTITTQPFKDAHFAVFPLGICWNPILSSCPPDGIVLDPFGGSGTVAEAVELLNIFGKKPDRKQMKELRELMSRGQKPLHKAANRKWILFEKVSDYVAIAEKRLRPYR
jgi:DNA modification methylase